ncbi:hypothetical protein FHR70_002620 [Microvirga lupini]|uniref:Uncharacterized protein n=1 Tax=Microvirga lupini TaxID=420324 RepID=A0A7W4VLT6_9HYPH|nr:hypothetical protein [Microvirga lupini]
MRSGSLLLRSAGVVAILMIMSVGTDALAQSHPLTLRMSCAQAQNLVASQRAVVLNTGPLTYDRYVGSYGFCMAGETLDPAWVPTADTAQCPIGYRCTPRSTPSRN